MMITKEQKQEIIYDLLNKNLPLDLLVEVKDHMEEQLNHIMTYENKDFAEAYHEVRKSWEKDLTMCYAFRIPVRKTTVFQKNIMYKSDLTNLKNTFVYMIPIILLSVAVSFINKEWGSILHLSYYIIIAITTIYFLIFQYPYFRSANNNEKRKLSIYQAGTALFYLSGFYVILFNFISHEIRFDKFYESIINLLKGNYTEISFFALVNTYLFIFFWIYGLQHFIKYKQAIRFLQNKINLKL